MFIVQDVWARVSIMSQDTHSVLAAVFPCWFCSVTWSNGELMRITGVLFIGRIPFVVPSKQCQNTRGNMKHWSGGRENHQLDLAIFSVCQLTLRKVMSCCLYGGSLMPIPTCVTDVCDSFVIIWQFDAISLCSDYMVCWSGTLKFSFPICVCIMARLLH